MISNGTYVCDIAKPRRCHTPAFGVALVPLLQAHVSVVRFQYGGRVMRVPLYQNYPSSELASLLGAVFSLPSPAVAVRSDHFGVVTLSRLCADKRCCASIVGIACSACACVIMCAVLFLPVGVRSSLVV